MRSYARFLFVAAAFIFGAGSVAAAPVPCVAGMAGVYPCDKVEMLANMPLTAIGGGAGNDVWGWTDSTTGKEYAIIGLSNGTSFVDVSNPVNPLFLGRLPAPAASPAPCTPSFAPSSLATTFAPFVPDHDECPPDDSPNDDPPHLQSKAPQHCGSDSQWRDHEVYADHVFIGSEQSNHGLVTFDLRTLRNVVSPPVLFAQTARYCGFGNSHTISVNTQTGFVYANGTRTGTCGTSGGPHIVNVQNPGAPLWAGCDQTDGYTHDSQCLVYQGPDVAHQGKSICINSNEDTLTINDVTNPAAAARISRTSYAGSGYTHQGWITADHRYFLLDDELDENNFGHNTKTYIWDLVNLDAPVMMGFHLGPTQAIDHQQFIHGNFVYQSNYRAGLRILETKDIPTARLTEVGFFDVFPANNNRGFNGTWANYPFFPSGVVAVSTIESAAPGGFFLLRPLFADLQLTVTDSPDPVVVGQNVTYTFTVRNQGPTYASSVTLANTLNAGLTVISITPSQGTCSGTRTFTCSLGRIDNDQVATVTVVARVDSAGMFINSGRAVVSSSVETDTRLGDNTASERTTVQH